jgi:hypothetical protein
MVMKVVVMLIADETRRMVIDLQKTIEEGPTGGKKRWC